MHLAFHSSLMCELSSISYHLGCHWIIFQYTRSVGYINKPVLSDYVPIDCSNRISDCSIRTS